MYREIFTKHELMQASDLLTGVRTMFDARPGVYDAGAGFFDAYDASGHCALAASDGAVRFTLAGAIANLAARFYAGDERTPRVAITLLRRAMAPGYHNDAGYHPYSLADWTSTPGRTYSDVWRVLTQAIDAADADAVIAPTLRPKREIARVRQCACEIDAPMPEHTMRGCVCPLACACWRIASNGRMLPMPEAPAYRRPPASAGADAVTSDNGREFYAYGNVAQSAYDNGAGVNAYGDAVC